MGLMCRFIIKEAYHYVGLSIKIKSDYEIVI